MSVGQHKEWRCMRRQKFKRGQNQKRSLKKMRRPRTEKKLKKTKQKRKKQKKGKRSLIASSA
eukprot:9682744-Karenia_brevis.AAC.1